MPELVSTQVTRQFVLQSLAETCEPQSDRTPCPRPAVCVATNRTVRILRHQPASHFQRSRSQEHDAGLTSLATSLLLAGREDPQLVFQINVAGFDRPRLLRPDAGFLDQHDQISKSRIAGLSQNELPLLPSEHSLTPLARRLLKPLQWRMLQMALIDCPLECPLDGCDRAAAGIGPPCRLPIDPASHMERPDVAGQQIRRQGAHEVFRNPRRHS